MFTVGALCVGERVLHVCVCVCVMLLTPSCEWRCLPHSSLHMTTIVGLYHCAHDCVIIVVC